MGSTFSSTCCSNDVGSSSSTPFSTSRKHRPSQIRRVVRPSAATESSLREASASNLKCDPVVSGSNATTEPKPPSPPCAIPGKQPIEAKSFMESNWEMNTSSSRSRRHCRRHSDVTGLAGIGRRRREGCGRNPGDSGEEEGAWRILRFSDRRSSEIPCNAVYGDDENESRMHRSRTLTNGLADLDEPSQVDEEYDQGEEESRVEGGLKRTKSMKRQLNGLVPDACSSVDSDGDWSSSESSSHRHEQVSDRELALEPVNVVASSTSCEKVSNLAQVFQRGRNQSQGASHLLHQENARKNDDESKKEVHKRKKKKRGKNRRTFNAADALGTSPCFTVISLDDPYERDNTIWDNSTLLCS